MPKPNIRERYDALWQSLEAAAQSAIEGGTSRDDAYAIVVNGLANNPDPAIRREHKRRQDEAAELTQYAMPMSQALRVLSADNREVRMDGPIMADLLEGMEGDARRGRTTIQAAQAGGKAKAALTTGRDEAMTAEVDALLQKGWGIKKAAKKVAQGFDVATRTVERAIARVRKK